MHFPRPQPSAQRRLCLEFLKRLPAAVPVLGVCLGHQLLGYFAGAEVSRAPYVMHGKSSDIIHDGSGLFTGLPNPMTVGRYHSLVVQSKEDEPNPRFTVTSRGPEGEVMALRYNDRPWVGIPVPSGIHPDAGRPPAPGQLPGQHRSGRAEGKAHQPHSGHAGRRAGPDGGHGRRGLCGHHGRPHDPGPRRAAS